MGGGRDLPSGRGHVAVTWPLKFLDLCHSWRQEGNGAEDSTLLRFAVASEHVAPLKPAGCAGDGQWGGDGHRAECEVARGPSRGSGRNPGMFSQVSLCLKGNRLRGKGGMTLGTWLQHVERHVEVTDGPRWFANLVVTGPATGGPRGPRGPRDELHTDGPACRRFHPKVCLNQPKGGWKHNGSTSQKAGTEFERQEHPHFFRKKWYG